MADIIPGRQTINVGIQNQASGSDDLYTAFTKVETNFENLFANASPYLNVSGGTGILVTNPSSNSVSITNTGVTRLNPGTGITLNNANGEVTISVSGSLTGVVAGVTNVGISSTTLNISGSPIISRGIIAIELPTIPNSGSFNPGTYVSPTLTIDQYGRIIGISSISTAGTVTQVAVTAGDGISVTGSPIIDSGTISIVNTGVTQLTAGPGITLSGSKGSITISGITPSSGTVTRVDVTSSTLTVTGSPITSSGTVNIELPNTLNLNKLTGANIVSTGPISAVANISTTGNIVANGNVSGITFIGNVEGKLDGIIGATSPANATFANISINSTASITGNISGGNLSIATNANVLGALKVSSTANLVGNVTAGNINATGTITGGLITGTTAVVAPQMVVATTVPGSLYNGSIAIDSVGNRLVVVYGGTIHYINVTS
jgi:hypothetical protein